jgi:hypothetical protein
MAKTIINLSDPVSVLVSKTNTISDHIGDITALTVGASVDSDIVQAINHLNSNIQSSAQIIATAKSGLQKDSANGIGFDSSQGRFFIPTGTINPNMLENLAVTTPRIAADAIDGTKIADDAINSEHYVDGSIDTQHIADDQITEAKMADDAIGSVQMKTLSTLLIKDVAGNTLKTIHGAGA